MLLCYLGLIGFEFGAAIEHCFPQAADRDHLVQAAVLLSRLLWPGWDLRVSPSAVPPSQARSRSSFNFSFKRLAFY